MNGLGDGDRRSVEHKGETLYKPWCDDCRSDDHTRYVRDGSPWQFAGVTIQGRCDRCDGAIIFTPAMQFAAREPQRLAERLEELRREAAQRQGEFILIGCDS